MKKPLLIFDIAITATVVVVAGLSGCALEEGRVDCDVEHNVYVVKTHTGVVITHRYGDGYLYVNDDGKAEWFGAEYSHGKEPPK